MIMHACRELESIKREVKALNVKSSDTEQVVDKLVSVCKDLTVEVFACTEQLKKRNGMFTDLLVPDLKLTLKLRKHFNRNELALQNPKIVDNLVSCFHSKFCFDMTEAGVQKSFLVASLFRYQRHLLENI